MADEDVTELYGRIGALEAVLVNLLWRFAQSLGDQGVQALATVMMNANANLAEATRAAVGEEELAARVAAEESLGRFTEALTREIAKAAPEAERH